MLNQHTRHPIGIIDVETTGFHALGNDRVVEVAAVVLEGGRITREFVSLVNPERDVGPSSIHGITAGDIRHAPRFVDVAGALLETLSGTVAIAGHNVRFDKQFIEREFLRIERPIPPLSTICTMRLAGGGRLSKCCTDHNIEFDGESHNALVDARATARLLLKLASAHPESLQHLSGLGPIDWPVISVKGSLPVTRKQSRLRQTAPPSYLQRLLGRMPRQGELFGSDESIMEYTALLDRVLEDRSVDEAEGDALVSMATSWGLTSQQIRLAHREFTKQLAIVALADGVLSDAERDDLRLAARLLGQSTQDVEEALRDARSLLADGARNSSAKGLDGTSLSGKLICFTEELQCQRNGQPITREMAIALASKAGLKVVDSVTKRLEILVVSDPHTQSGKATRARRYGVRVMHEPVFWQAIGVHLD